MSLKKTILSALVCTLLTTCISVPANAQEPAPPDADILYSGAVARATETINVSVDANKIAVSRSSFSLEQGETVTFDCTYSPKSADIDIGLMASDGTVYFVSGSNGYVSKSIRISQRGTYTLAVRNNSSSSVTVTGIISY